MIRLSPEHLRELVDALASGFTRESLEQRVMRPMGVSWSEISGSRSSRDQIFELVLWAHQHERAEDLLRFALDANPNSEPLRRLNEATGLIATTSDGFLEAIRPALLMNEKAWSSSLTEVRRQVCLVSGNGGNGALAGTGFLVGPDQVMTHAQVIGNSAAEAASALKRGQISVLFDRASIAPLLYQVLSEPDFVSEGVFVLRLNRPAGRDIATDFESSFGGRGRGWIAPRAPAGENRAVVIVQFAEDTRPTVSIDADGLIPGDGPFIEYRTSTQAGSMGAPCFDANWRLIGVHVGSGTGPYNRGIGIATIIEQLREHNLVWDVQGVYPDPSKIESAGHQGDFDALVRNFELAADGYDSEDDVWADDVEEDASNPDRWKWAEAAAVTAYFIPEKLKPDGNPPAAALVPVLLNSSPIRRGGDVAHWMLSDRIRVRALERLAERGAMQTVRAKNAGDPGEILDVVLGAFIAGVPPARAELQDPDRVRAMLQVTAWLARTGVETPPPAELRATLDRAVIIAPFRHLTRGFFAGRDSELAALAAYVDGPETDEHGLAPAPIQIHGPGGTGKSALLAHFILAHAQRDTTKPEAWRPFVYLDFDRPELDARDLSGVLLAIARQIGPQVPSLQSTVDALLKRWSDRRHSDRGRTVPALEGQHRRLAPRASETEIDGLVAELASILNAVHAALPEPLVLVVDTLEEVQYATPDAVAPLARMVVKLRAAVPSLRPVLSGRVEIDAKLNLTLMPLGPLPPAAAEALLTNHLPAELAAKTDLVSRMVQIVGGNPLSLRLAAEVLREEAHHNLDQLGEEKLWERVGDEVVQGQLYERIVGHLHEGPIKKLAMPGLVLRYITWELIRDVLAGPCGVEVEDDATAQQLFGELAREIALVRQSGDGNRLVLRPELRRTVLDSFRNDGRSKDKRGEIHEAAVAYFAALSGQANRAEEIYHRLWLDQEPEAIDARWLAGLEPTLRSAVEELRGRARSYLANRVGGVDEGEFERTAAPAEWEAYAEKRASDLLRLGAPAAAIEVLQRRADRLPTSRLHLIESIARRSLPEPDLAAAEAAAISAVGAAKVSADLGQTQNALQELIQIRRLRNDTTGLLRALAELGKLGEQLGDDLILLQASVEGLESVPAKSDATERLTETAVRVFSRLPDELIARAPELARRVAAQAGADNPALLQRVVRLVGLGPLNKEAAAGLGSVLTNWAHRDQQIAPFVPELPANATDLSSATQYLLANRIPDLETAEQVSSWLQTVVMPSTLTRG